MKIISLYSTINLVVTIKLDGIDEFREIETTTGGGEGNVVFLC